MSFLLVLSVIVLPENGFAVSALTADKTYYTERGTTERFTSATADDFASTVADLVAAGYTEYSQNAIAFNGKSDTAGANNLYAVYLNADKTELKHIAFHTNTKALHITTQTLNTNDALALSEAPEYTGICDPLFIQIMPDETVVSAGTSGMVYALRMRDGRFIMIDSGMEIGDNTYQADNIYNVLEENNVLDEITIDDFLKVDLRVCEVKKCTEIRKSHNCLKLVLFDGIKERTIVSSIKNEYKPEELVGKKIIVVANLKPARLTGVTSEGMLLAGTNNACGCKVIFVDPSVPCGTRIK